MKERATYSIELDKPMEQFLEEMAKKYQLSGIGKAVRSLINFAREKQDLQEAIFSEVRCPDC